MVVSALISPACFVKSMVTAHEALSVLYERSITNKENSEPLRFPNALPLVTPEEEKEGSLNSLKLDSFSFEHQRTVRHMMLKYRSM